MPPLSASTLVTMLAPVLLPRRDRVLAPPTRLFRTLVSTNGPEPSAWISLPPVVEFSWMRRFDSSPAPTYCRMAPPVVALPSLSAPVVVFALVLVPTLVPTPGLPLLPSVLTVSVPAVTLVAPA